MCARGQRHVQKADNGNADYGVFAADWLLGNALYAQGRYTEALRPIVRRSRCRAGPVSWVDVEDLLEDLAIIAATLGAHEQAAELFGAAATWRALDADPRPAYAMPGYLAATSACRHGLGPRRWQAAFDGGARLTSRQAMRLARAAVDGLRGRAVKSTLGLTARERQVLSLIADGSHDHEVAERLELSRRTVHAHLRSVYAKLDVTTRTAAVHRATDLGLIDATTD